jgi:hypothetical protein
MLSHLVYVSTRKPICTEIEIQKILNSCERNNRDIDITGVLLYSDTQFIQYIEGPYSIIISLYDKIKTDPRHKNPVLISNSPIEKRLFPSWQMGSRKFDRKTIGFNTAISDSDSRLFQSILDGQTQQGNRAMALIQKFFK